MLLCRYFPTDLSPTSPLTCRRRLIATNPLTVATINSYFGAPMQTHGRPYCFVAVLYFRTPSSEVTERNSAKLCDTFGSESDLKRTSKIWGPSQKRISPKLSIFGLFLQISAERNKLATNEKNYEGSPTIVHFPQNWQNLTAHGCYLMASSVL